MSTHARTVLHLLEQLDVDSATVVGHSMGGLVSIEMAKEDPQRVRRLVLVDAGGVPMTERRLAVVLFGLRIGGAIMQRGLVRRALTSKAWLRRLALRAAFVDPSAMSPALAAATMPVFAGPGFVDSVAAAGRAARATVPESITCPVLLVWGERDVIAPVQCAQEMRVRLRDCELVVIDGTGHSPMIERPGAFNEAVLNFVAAQQ